MGGLLFSSFKRFEISDERSDLFWGQHKFWHGRMPCQDSFRQRFGKGFNRIVVVERAKRRGFTQWARAGVADGMASRTILFGDLTPDLVRGLCAKARRSTKVHKGKKSHEARCPDASSAVFHDEPPSVLHFCPVRPCA